MKMNEIYEAPVMEVLNVAVEAGFAGSPGDPGFGEGDGSEGFPG